MLRHGHTTLIEIIRLAEGLEIWLPPSTIIIVEANIRHVFFEEWKFRDEHTTLIEIIRLADSLENWYHHQKKTIESNIRHVSFEELAATWPRIAVRTAHEIFLHEAVFQYALETHNMVAIPMVAMQPSHCRFWILEAITANGTVRVVIVNCEYIHIRRWTLARRLATT